MSSVVRGPWSVVCGPWSVSIDSHVQYISFSLFTYCRTMMAFQRTERRQWGGGLGGVPPPSKDIITVYWRQYIVAFTDVFLLTQEYLLCKYCTVLISVDSNERKYCAVLTSVDSTDWITYCAVLTDSINANNDANRAYQSRQFRQCSIQLNPTVFLHAAEQMMIYIYHFFLPQNVNCWFEW